MYDNWLLYRRDEQAVMAQDLRGLKQFTRIRGNYVLVQVLDDVPGPLVNRLLCLADVDHLLQGGSLPEPRTLWDRLSEVV
jgi:hypothetical protein